MKAFKPKWVNPILYIMKLTHLDLKAFISYKYMIYNPKGLKSGFVPYIGAPWHEKDSNLQF